MSVIVESGVKQYKTKPIKRLKSQIILKSLGASKSKGLNRLAKIS
jgi:hypothetical protein